MTASHQDSLWLESSKGGLVAKLISIRGPLRTSEFALDADLYLGRAADNGISLEDPEIAAHHCKISVVGHSLILNDLGSTSGTFVNGLPIKRRELKSGDEIAVGGSLFLINDEEYKSVPTSSLCLHDAPEPLSLKPLDLSPEHLETLSATSLAALQKVPRLERNFNALLQLSRAISGLRDEESLPWQLLGVIFDIIPAERGAILILEHGSDDIRSQTAWDRVTGPEQTVSISRQLVDRVVRERIALMSDDSGLEYSSAPAQRDANSPRRSFLCVPMVLKAKTLGVIYLESLDASAGLTEEDFRLLAGIAGLGVVGIENARQYERLGSENQRLLAQANLTHDMVGSSVRMLEVYQFIERVAPSDSTVLIFGESGTGKELAARAIHNNSPRKNQPFVALNCAALTETLLESELFGHEKGAFTSATNQKKGFLEVAEGGTIFLDEIGELSPTLQAKLLRVLQEREFVRVGGVRPIKLNVRFLAATHKDLQKAQSDQTFRPDLFHRLNVISITLPSLRERPEDIPILAQHFAAIHAKTCNRNVHGISDKALDSLKQYDWPGNIRELENAIERAMVVGTSETILAEDLPETVLESTKAGAVVPANYHEAIIHLKKQLINGALDQAQGNITEAAKLLGVHANYLHRLMRNLELRPAAKKQYGG
jgi:transcriptional regulator with GAF, ATPase, and Fis domain